MKLLADENQHVRVIARLRAAGYVVEAVAETAAGTPDGDILRRPDIGGLALVTYDRDFGDLIFNRGYPAPAAILYTRLKRNEPDIIADRLLDILATGPVRGHMIVIGKDGVRMRPFPLGDTNG